MSPGTLDRLSRSRWLWIGWSFVFLVQIIRGMTTGQVWWYFGFLDVESCKVLAYLMLGTWLVFTGSMAVNMFKPDRVNCLTSIKALAVIYVIQVLGYLAFRSVHWMLFAPGAIMFLVWAISCSVTEHEADESQASTEAQKERESDRSNGVME